MKTRSSTQAQDPRQWQELAAADPAYREWHEARNAEDQDERDGNSWWNDDGFSPEGCRYAH